MTRPAMRWARYAIAVCAHHGGLDALYRHLTGAGLVVLMLHRLRDEPDPWPLSTSTAAFAQFVRWLRERQLLVGLDEGLQALAAGGRAVRYAITFDDGYHDNLGVMATGDDRYGDVVPAIVYVATAHVGGESIWVYRLHHAVEARTHHQLDLGSLGLGHFDLDDSAERTRLYAVLPPRLKQLAPAALEACVDAVIAQVRPAATAPARPEMLDWRDLRTLDASGVQIGAHTRHHVLLSRVDDATARSEIVGSQADIAAVASPPVHFAYPNGGASDFSERDVRIVREAGFRTAVTSIEGTNRRGVDPYRILRHNVHDARYRDPGGRLSKALFFSETSGVLGWLRSLRPA